MENSDMSIMLGNDSVVHHPMNNHKKLINDSGGDVHFDSGYASVASISSNQTDASASTSMKKSLVPIAENYELQFDDASGSSIIETPTTRNTRQLSAFHIQTPPNDKRMMETTPTKANNYWALRSSQKSSTKENRNSAMSPYKVTPNKRKSSDSNYLSFTDEKMKSGDKFEQFSLYDLPKENAEDSFEMSTNEPSISPITNHNKSSTSTATTILGINRRTLQRHPSGIESSTPISRSFKRTHTQTIVKAHFDGDNAENARALKRKFKSFSPAKRNNVLKEISINTPVLLERHDEEDVSDAARAHNPARKVLQFSTNQFDNLLSGHASVAWMPSQAVPRVESTITPTKSTMTTRTATLQRQQHIALSPSPTRSELPNQCIQEEAMRRPMKNLKRSTVAVAPTTPNGKRLEKELHKTSIHRTSPRSPLRNPLKRSATTAQGDESVTGEATAEPPAKRKLFYDGLEKLDILTHLKGANNVTDLILSKLSDKDLYASYHVSQSWSQIITNNTPAYSRQSRYARLSQHQKENVNGRNLRTVSEPSTVQTSKRIPFAARNAHYSLRSSPRRSPPVSPSKRKFHENQKVVKELEKGQRLTRCPRCDGNSIVHPESEPLPKSPSPQKLNPSLLFRRRKGYSCPINTNNASPITIPKAWKSFDERKNKDVVVSEYAVCSRLVCGFSFCTNCRCDRHVDSECQARPISSSPTSDEDTVSRPNDKKRAMRRLLKQN